MTANQPTSTKITINTINTPLFPSPCSLQAVFCVPESPPPLLASTILQKPSTALKTPNKAAQGKLQLPNTTKQLTNTKNPPIKLNTTESIQERINYAWSISHDLDFIYTLDYENGGTWRTDKRSDIIGANGYYDYGICQINKGYHKHIVNDPRFADPKWQIDQCWKLYKNGTTFYGYYQRHKVIARFTQ